MAQKYLLACLCTLFAQVVDAQSYEMHVGETETLSAPDPPQGTIDYGEWSCSNSNVWINKNGRGESADVKIGGYFTGTATILCSIKYTWYDGSASAGNRYKSGYTSKSYTVTAKPTEVKLNKTYLELEPGDEVELYYTTSPSGLEPEVEWITTDKNIASLSSIDEEYYHVEKVSRQKKVKICANTIGNCVIKLGCNTGYTAPTCSVTVKDDRPHVSANVPSGVIKKGTKVSLSCDRVGADIRYTTDKSDPTKNSLKYTSPIEINESMTLKAKAFVNGEESRVLTLDYKVVAHMPGEIFTSKSIEGVDVIYKVIEESALVGKTAYLQVGTGETYSPAINKNYTGRITVPEKVDGMFVKYIGKHAFYECNISSFVFNNYNSITIRENAFANCSKLVSIETGTDNGSSTKIESFAFYHCDILDFITFHSSIAPGTTSDYHYSDYNFYECDNIKTIYCYQEPEVIMDNTFPLNVYENATLYVRENYINNYKNCRGWKKFQNIRAIGSEPAEKIQLTASPSGGEVSSGAVVKLTSIPSGADIYYTLNGSTPSKNSTPYSSSGITISSNCTLKAIAYKSGYEDSDVLTATYTIKENPKPKLTLSASPSGGQVTSGTTVTLTAKANGSTVSGCDIYFTTNGSNPSRNNGTKYSSGVTINSACTLKAIAYKSGYEDSDVLTTSYTIKQEPKPKLTLSASPSGGQVTSGTIVTLTAKADGSTVSGCDIYFTTDGSSPSRNNGTKYSSGVTINSACTLKAIAYKDGYEDSDVLTASYTIKQETKPKLTLSASPSGGQVTSGTTVTLTAKANGSTVSGCDIYFTTNGSNPSRNNGTKYSSGVTINSNCTVKAIAYKDGYETSDVLSMTYTIKQYQKLYLLASPNSGQVPKGAVVALTAAGGQKESFVEVKSGNMVYGPWETCFWIVFPQEYAFHKGDKWQVSMRVRAEKEANSETQIHKNPNEYLYYQGIGDVTFTTEWCTYANSGTFSVNQDGGYSICFNLNCFEDANTYYFDDISFKINGIELISNGSCDDANGTVKYYSKENNATIVPSRIVTIITGSNTISDCDIYYTLNGSTPTKSSTKYTSSGITISEACTLKAIAYKKGFEASDILTENYTIKKVNEEIVVATCVGIIMGDNGQTYRVTGIVESIENIALGYWYLKDSTGIIYIHGTRDEDGSPFYALHKRGIEVGDVVTVEGLKASNNGQTELENVRIVNSNPSDINDVQTTGRIETSVFSLSGQRLAAPRKGINIIGGRKVIVK